MTTRRGIIAIIAIFAAITAGGFLTGTGAAHSSKPRAKANKVEATLAEHEKRIAALETALAELTSAAAPAPATTPVSSTPQTPPHIRHRQNPDPEPEAAPATPEPAPTTTAPQPAPATPEPAPTTTAPQPAPAAPAPSGGCSYPSGSAGSGWETIGSTRLSSGQTLDGFVMNASGNHGILPANVSNTTVRNGIINADGVDNIKLGDNSRYENLYLRMADSGGHLDAMQGQGATGVTVRNVTIEMTSHGGVTGAILMQNMLGGGAGYRDITFDFDCIRLIGSGPYGHDIRVGASNGQTTRGRITRTVLDGGMIMMSNRGGTCIFEVDSVSMPYVRNDGCEIVAI